MALKPVPAPASETPASAAFGIIADDMTRVETILRDNVRSEVGLILQVGDYILDSGGKRFRPALVLLSAGALGYRGEGHAHLAAAMEYIHTATLLHDDVVDDAIVRRGHPAVRAVWDNHVSVLVGDYLFARAFSMILKWTNNEILTFIAEACVRMAEGEAYQLQRIGRMASSEDDYVKVVTDKTAGLIAACSRAGALLAEARPEHIEALHRFGLKVGIAFQMADDALDYTSDEEHLGKTIGKDLLEGKVTLPLIYALTKCTAQEKDAVEKIIAGRNPTLEDLAYVSEIINTHGGIDYSYGRARTYVSEAKTELDRLPPSDYTATLAALANYAVTRES